MSDLTLNLSTLNVIADVLGTSSINLATNTKGGTQDLLHRTLQILGQRLKTHRAGNLDNLVERDRFAVLDILLLLAVARRLLERPDDKGRGGGDNRHSGLSVLDGKFDGNSEAFL